MVDVKVGMPISTRKHEVNSSPPSAAYLCQWIGSALVQIMACRLFGAKPLSEPMLEYCYLDPWNILQWNHSQNLYIFVLEMHLKISLGNWRPFCHDRNVLISRTQFPFAIVFFVFQHYRNIVYLLNIIFILDRCCHCGASATSVSYQYISTKWINPKENCSSWRTQTNGASITSVLSV